MTSVPLKSDPQGNCPVSISFKNDSVVVPGDKNELSAMTKYPSSIANASFKANKQQLVIFIVPCPGLRGGVRERPANCGMASEMLVKLPFGAATIVLK